MGTRHERKRLLDAIDKRMSWCVFSLELGKMEWALSVPGVWHGIPACSLVWMTSLLVLCDAPEHKMIWTCGVCVPLFLYLFMRWVVLIRQGDHYPMYSTTYLPYMLGTLLAVLATARIMFGFTDHGIALPCFYVSSYLFTQVFVVILKTFARRVRPGIALSAQLNGTSRYLKTLNYHNKKGYTVFESFPSGDVAGAMVFSHTIAIATGSSTWPYVFACMSAFGRMYFFAHHLGDVSVGALFAWIVTNSVHAVVGWQNVTILHAFAICIPSRFLINYVIKRYRKPLPKIYEVDSTPVRKPKQVW